LVYQSFDWNHGVFLGSIVGSEVTAAAIGLKAGVRRDPFAMLPFCGYHMGDYFGHWVSIGRNAPVPANLPKIFNVNWFRKGPDNKFLWPGYGDNIRVLKWIFETLEGTADVVETPIGLVPGKNAIDVSGLPDVAAKMDKILEVNPQEWLDECELIAEHQAIFGNRLPKEMTQEFEKLKERLHKAIK
jgi:phosphoenolpyruvate carboxykinase (GTP)